jgi:hypothetical protein
LAEGIREGFSDLFAINTKAQEFTVQEVKNKLRTLYAGKKTDLVVGNIAKTFRALCDYADFSSAPPARQDRSAAPEDSEKGPTHAEQAAKPSHGAVPPSMGKIQVSGLQYHINIVLPETRDQTVFDAIFKALREHLG